MHRHHLAQAIPQHAGGASVALGNFDGVHKGHQAVIAAAAEHGAALAAAVFEPHPRRFFQPEEPPFRLQSDAQRERALTRCGVQHLFTIAFDRALSELSDRAFAQEVLSRQLGAAHVSVGADFRFGNGRMGDAERLQALGREFGFGVSIVAPVEHGGERYSSSAIRDVIAAGDVVAAAAMLTRPWAVEGVVQRGFQRGRAFGFPTANLTLGDYVRPRLGVYAVRVDLGDGAPRSGVASVGVNPTVGALPAPLLEAHIFDFNADLYGRAIEVEMMAFLREELHFSDVDAMKDQMALDAEMARALLASAGSS
jgi:riboflavin kinase/FMN adenylyltransferase